MVRLSAPKMIPRWPIIVKWLLYSDKSVEWKSVTRNLLCNNKTSLYARSCPLSTIFDEHWAVCSSTSFRIQATTCDQIKKNNLAYIFTKSSKVKDLSRLRSTPTMTVRSQYYEIPTLLLPRESSFKTTHNRGVRRQYIKAHNQLRLRIKPQTASCGGRCLSSLWLRLHPLCPPKIRRTLKTISTTA